MNTLYKKITLLTCILGMLTACTDVLDQVPEHVIADTNFWKTGNDAEAAIISGYDRLQNLWDGNIIALNVQSDEAESVTNNDRYDEFDRNNILADNNRVEQYWERNYNGIHRVNDVLDKVPTINDATFTDANRERILGEAYFLRAYYYFNLVRLYGGVPLITKPYETFKVDFTIAKSTPTQVYDQIIDDLQNAVLRLPLSYSSVFQTRGRATLGAAKALMTRVHLYRKEYSEAAATAAEVMAIPLYSLVTTANYPLIFTPSGKNSTEGIFEIQYLSSTQEGTDVWRRYLPSAQSGSPANSGGDYWARPTQAIMDAFEPGDIRKDVNIAISTKPPFNQAGLPYVSKYRRTSTGDDPNIFMIRLADVILMRAEALTQQDKIDEAIPLVNQIRNRAGLPNTLAVTKEQVLDAIAKERLLELAFEGQRWHDLVRTEKAQQALGIANADKLLWPIPARERNVNPILDQNPGY